MSYIHTIARDPTESIRQSGTGLMANIRQENGAYKGRPNGRHHEFQLKDDDLGVTLVMRLARRSLEKVIGDQPTKTPSMVRFIAPDLVSTFVIHGPDSGNCVTFEAAAPELLGHRFISALTTARPDDRESIIAAWNEHAGPW